MSNIDDLMKCSLGSGKDTFTLIHPDCDNIKQESTWGIGDTKSVYGCENGYYTRYIKWDGEKLEEVWPDEYEHPLNKSITIKKWWKFWK